MPPETAENPQTETEQVQAVQSPPDSIQEPAKASPEYLLGLNNPLIAEYGKPYRFTKENAKFYNAKAVAAIKERFKASPYFPLPPLKPEPSAYEKKLIEQIESLDDLLDGETDYKAIDALTRGKERLMRCYFHLAGIAGPGNLRPTKSRSREVRPPVEPV